MVRTLPLGLLALLVVLVPLRGQEDPVDLARVKLAEAEEAKEVVGKEMVTTYAELKHDFEFVRSSAWERARGPFVEAVAHAIESGEPLGDPPARLIVAFRDAGVLSEITSGRLARAVAQHVATNGAPTDPGVLLGAAIREVFPEETFDLCWDSAFQDLPVVERWRDVYAEFEKAKKALEEAEAAAGPPGPDGMVLVPKGRYTVGPWAGWENDIKRNKSQQKRIDAFFLDVNEVTNEKYREFLAATKAPDAYLPVDIRKTAGGDFAVAQARGSHPARGMTFEAAQAFAEWAGKRLPTEVEWEAAARGSDARLYPWGPEFFEDATNWNGRGLGRPTSVGASPKDRSPFGAMDMAGNVSEFTATLAGGKTARGKLKLSDTVVYRGGNYGEGKENTTATYRWMIAAVGGKSELVGFRCAVSEKDWKRR